MLKRDKLEQEHALEKQKSRLPSPRKLVVEKDLESNSSYSYEF